jgi:2,4-dienoyl-CoA reductase-like NADH-dependent reductase (Old Yellow Enzyme family)
VIRPPSPQMTTKAQAGRRRTLASPLALGGRVLKNRLVVAPICTNYASPDGSASAQLVEYYRARGRGGAALVTTEIAFIDDLGSRGFVAQLGAHHDRMIPGLNDVAEAIREGGALAGLQIGHCGSQRGLKEPPLVSASPVPWAPTQPVPKALTMAEIAGVVKAFAAAARRAAAAGFDLVEVHAAHGYLVNAFLSPAMNRRRDRYGGSSAARSRFALEIATAIRKEIGPELLLSFRINGDDLLPDGLTIADYRVIARALVDAGADLLHVSAGTYRAMNRRISPIYMAEGPFVDLAAAIKQAVPVPVIASDTIHDPVLAEDILRRGFADLVSMARPNFADPDLPAKILAGEDGAIIPCIRCNTCLAREQGGKRAYCAVNPATGREGEQLIPASRARRVLVVGAGPAGIACAVAAAQRGHVVTVAERGNRVGGQVAAAADLPFKVSLRRLCAQYDHALRAANVQIRLGYKVDASSALLAEHDVVVSAIGPRWTIGWMQARDGPPILDALSAISGAAVPSGKIVVVGATMIGAEVAWHCALVGGEVILVERRLDFADDVNLIYRVELAARLAEAGVSMQFGTEALSVGAAGIVLRSDRGECVRAVDAVVAAFGAQAAAPLPVPGIADGVAFRVGECAGQFGLLASTHDGYRLGRRL